MPQDSIFALDETKKSVVYLDTRLMILSIFLLIT